MAEKIKLTYLNFRGLAEPIRFVFAYAGVEYEDIRIGQDEWPTVKQNYPWGQVPILEMGSKTLSQSNAILRYLGRKYNLAGEDEWEMAKIDEFSDAFTDLRLEWRKSFMEQDAAKKAELEKTLYEVTIPKYFSKFEAQINSNEGRPLVIGKKLTWFDLQLAHFLELFANVKSDLLDGYPTLQKLKDHIFALPQIKEWVAKRPVTPF